MRLVFAVLLPDFVIELVCALGDYLLGIFWPEKAYVVQVKTRARLIGLKTGWRAKEIGRGVVFSNSRTVKLANGVSIKNHVNIICGRGSFAIGANSHIGHGSLFAAAGGIAIGEDCAISSGVIVYSVTDGVPTEGQHRHLTPPTFSPVKIGDHVHIGANATILPGVSIGHGSTIGAGAVVIRDVAEGSVVVGVPAKALNTDGAVIQAN